MNQICICQSQKDRAVGLCLDQECRIRYFCEQCEQTTHQNHRCQSFQNIINSFSEFSQKIQEISQLISVRVIPKLDTNIKKLKREKLNIIEATQLSERIFESYKSIEIFKDFLQKFDNQRKTLVDFVEKPLSGNETDNQPEQGYELFNQNSDTQTNREIGNTITTNPTRTHSKFDDQYSVSQNTKLELYLGKQGPKGLVQQLHEKQEKEKELQTLKSHLLAQEMDEDTVDEIIKEHEKKFDDEQTGNIIANLAQKYDAQQRGNLFKQE